MLNLSPNVCVCVSDIILNFLYSFDPTLSYMPNHFSFSESTPEGTEGWAKYCKEELYNQVYGQAIKLMGNIIEECCKAEKSVETVR